MSHVADACQRLGRERDVPRVTAALTRNLQISLANQTHFAEVGLACETREEKEQQLPPLFPAKKTTTT